MLHLRIPFSFFLLPVFLFALSQSKNAPALHVFLTFFILHFLLYPASNAYNSYFDKDEGSIGGLKNPPPVQKSLYVLSLAFDCLALLLSLLISPEFTAMVFLYGLISKAYSHPSIRLKKMPVAGLLVVALFQGLFTFLMCSLGISGSGFSQIFTEEHIFTGLLTSILLLGSYPMTQVYQHEEDANRGDITISLKLGVKGTFHFTFVVFSLAGLLFFRFFFLEEGLRVAVWFLVFLSPTIVFFLNWYRKVSKYKGEANYTNTMRLNFISTVCLNLFFTAMILQVF